MKKIIPILLALFVLSFISCSEEKETSSISPYTEFKDYETFSANKSAWKEPKDYTFTYTYERHAVYLQPAVTVNVKNGVSTFVFPDDFSEEHYEKIASIAEAYEYFDKHWQEVKAEQNNSLQICFSASYDKTDSNYAYPKLLYEDIQWAKYGDAPYGADSGGMRIKITDFKEN